MCYKYMVLEFENINYWRMLKMDQQRLNCYLLINVIYWGTLKMEQKRLNGICYLIYLFN